MDFEGTATKTLALAKLGQSPWYDDLTREMIDSHKLQHLIQQGIQGITANPTTFAKALSDSSSYDLDIKTLAKQIRTKEDIYNHLLIEDARKACQIFKPLYEKTQGKDGYVSLEVSPDLAHDTKATITTARYYWEEVSMPNLMIKIPATDEGLEAIEESLFRGLNINITLIFGLKRYKQVVEAYFKGLERRLGFGGQINNVHSVASFFISRIDTEIDLIFDHFLKTATLSNWELVKKLRGQTGIALAALVYKEFQNIENCERYKFSQAFGLNIQRPLWASTSVKNPNYEALMYCRQLIAPNTINTISPNSLPQLLLAQDLAPSLEGRLEESLQFVATLKKFNIDLDLVATSLEIKGLEAFQKSKDKALSVIEQKS